MNNLAKSLILGAFSIAMVACNSDQPKSEIKIVDASNRGAATMAVLKGQEVSIQAADIIIAKKMQAAQNDDAAVANKVMQSTLAAEGTHTMTDVQLVANDKSEGGMFIFSLEAEQTKTLSIQLYDEEGFGMAANNTISINSGKNYKAINVNSLEDGTYKMYLKDEEGKEIVSRVVVDNE